MMAKIDFDVINGVKMTLEETVENKHICIRLESVKEDEELHYLINIEDLRLALRKLAVK